MAEKKKNGGNVPIKSRTKRQQLISSATSLTSLFGGHTASSSAAPAAASIEKQLAKQSKMAKKPNQKQREGSQKERWLLTRKTWKYMADAGRRLIPEGMQHRSGSTSQDLKKIEEYFQHVCRSEPKFLPWRRKQSYPGAMGASLRRSSKRRTIALRMFGRGMTGSSSAVDNKSGASSTLSSPPTKANSADESEDDFSYSGSGGDENQKMFLMIRMLEKYLKITDTSDIINDAEGDAEEFNDEACKSPISTQSMSMWQPKTATNTNTTTSPTYSVLSDEDLGFSRGSSIAEDNDHYIMGHKSSTPPGYPYYSELDHNQKRSTLSNINISSPTSSEHSPITSPQHVAPQADFTNKAPSVSQNSSSMHTSLLLESLRNYSRTSRHPLLSTTILTPSVLQDKQLLRRIRDELKQQQLERIFRRHGPGSSLRTSSSMYTIPSTSTSSLNLTSHIPATKSSLPQRKQYDDPSVHTSSVSASLHSSPLHTTGTGTSSATRKTESLASRISRKFHSHRYQSASSNTSPNDENVRMAPSATIQPHSNDNVTYATTLVPMISVKCESQDRQPLICNSGTQTDPITVNHLSELYNDYQRMLQSRQAAEMSSTSNKKEAGADKSANSGKSTEHPDSDKHSRRKSSIDNEDVSQSVSDTIKRYLRMARKKTSSKDDANRFKRINYDTNLRNIKPKGEIPKPDELELDRNIKNTQTNDDWIALVVAEVSYYMAAQSPSPTSGGDSRNKKMLSMGLVKSTSPPPSHSSPPSPPGGFFQTSTQFISKCFVN